MCLVVVEGEINVLVLYRYFTLVARASQHPRPSVRSALSTTEMATITKAACL